MEIGFYRCYEGETRNNPDFIEKVLNLDNKDKTKWLLLKWPPVLYRMKRNKQP